MNTKAMVPLVLAVVLGLTAALMVRSAMGHKQGARPAAGNLVAVVVAKADADAGRALTIEDVATARVPAETMPAGGAFSDPAALVGRVTMVPLVRGQAVYETLLAPAGSASGLAALVPPGMRALTMEVTEHSGVGGMLEPGCRVDVMCIVHDEKGNKQQCRTVLQNVKVTAVGRSMTPSHPTPGQPPAPPSNALTVLVTPKQAQVLELATTTGRPWLVLRSTRDGAEVPLEGTTMAELTGQPDKPDADPALADNTAPPANAAVVPVVAPPTTAPATVVTTDGPDMAPIPATIRRVITVINGDVQQKVTVAVPNPRAALIHTDNGYVN